MGDTLKCPCISTFPTTTDYKQFESTMSNLFRLHSQFDVDINPSIGTAIEGTFGISFQILQQVPLYFIPTHEELKLQVLDFAFRFHCTSSAH